MSYTNPTTAQFQAQFARDFQYGSDPSTSVTDGDITNAFAFVPLAINQSLFGTQAAYTLGFLLLAAHYLVLNIRTAGQGLSGQYNFLQASKGVGSVSESFAIPPRILENPAFAMMAKTNYGAMYLQLIIPQICGAVFIAAGATRA